MTNTAVKQPYSTIATILAMCYGSETRMGKKVAEMYDKHMAMGEFKKCRNMIDAALKRAKTKPETLSPLRQILLWRTRQELL
ncbi:MAG: hypothetical protein HYT30_02400 [Parcubacteria group bacterium]|nr:hypothetical protein [Parcubacteria group bacterium]